MLRQWAIWSFKWRQRSVHFAALALPRREEKWDQLPPGHLLSGSSWDYRKTVEKFLSCMGGSVFADVIRWCCNSFLNVGLLVQLTTSCARVCKIPKSGKFCPSVIGLKKQLDRIHNSSPISRHTTHWAGSLGFIFVEHLTFSDQISSLSKSCYYHVGQLRRNRLYLDSKTARTNSHLHRSLQTWLL